MSSWWIKTLCRRTMCSRWADTSEVVDEVNACSSIEAGLRVAFINIIFTVYSLVTWFTLEKWNKKFILSICLKIRLKHKAYLINLYTNLKKHLLCTHMCPDNLCMLLHCDMDLSGTHPPFPHSSCLCTLAGTDTDGNSPCWCIVLHSYTHFQQQNLQQIGKEGVYDNLKILILRFYLLHTWHFNS